MLEKTSVVSLMDIKESVPGLRLAPYPGSSESMLPAIRGIVPNTIAVTNPAPIAIHLNGIYLSQQAGLNVAALELERVEVLKGPQGVLAGRNATGGALNLSTVKPELGAFGFKQQVTLAQRGQVLSKTSVNMPIGESLAAKISYLNSSKDHDGIRNSMPGGIKFGERDSEAWRLDLRWKPTDRVTVDYGYDRSLTKSYDTPGQCILPGSYAIYGAAINFFASIDPRVAAYRDSCSHDYKRELPYAYALQKNSNLAEGHALIIEWEVSPTFTLKSITGYRKVDTANHILYGPTDGSVGGFRADSGPYAISNFFTGASILNNSGMPWTLDNESWSQEFQFLGQIDESLKYTTGIYYSKEKGNQHQGPTIGTYMPALATDFSTLPPTVMDIVTTSQFGVSSAESTATAVYGQLSWRPDVLERKLEVVPGIRYSRDHRQAVGYSNGATHVVVPAGPATALAFATIPNPTAYTGAQGDNTFSKTTPSLSLNYHWEPGKMAYAKMAKGYTTGGFDPYAVSAADFSGGYKPETITSLEMGMKGEFLERRLRTNLALFQSKFKDEQKTVNGPLGPTDWRIVNVGESTYKGLEADITAQVTTGLRLGFNYAWLKHEYTKWIDPVSGLDVHDKRELIVPTHSYAINLDYRFPRLGTLPGMLDFNLNYSHRDSISTPIALDATATGTTTPIPVDILRERQTTPGYNLVNMRLAWNGIPVGPGDKGDLTIALWAKNLADKRYATFKSLNYYGDAIAVWGEPRTVGVDVIYRY
ncbi:hypothetical protein B9N43_10340 [Denitratisoma sp. DHT3]|nr:hypothetical protein B9N43_10340 [Denitratisoma sp. DHT3]